MASRKVCPRTRSAATAKELRVAAALITGYDGSVLVKHHAEYVTLPSNRVRVVLGEPLDTPITALSGRLEVVHDTGRAGGGSAVLQGAKIGDQAAAKLHPVCLPTIRHPLHRPYVIVFVYKYLSHVLHALVELVL